MRRRPEGRADRVLAAIEIPALGLWVGGLVAFAAIFAPAAFAVVGGADVNRFAVLIATNLIVLGTVGYVLGGLAIVAAFARSIPAGDRTWDFIRAGLVALALGISAFEQHSIVPELAARTDVHSADYAQLHRTSTAVYGAVVVLAFAALLLAATRRDD